MMSKTDIERIVDEKLAKMRKQMIEELQGQVESEDRLKTVWDLDTRDCEEYYRLFSDGEIVSIPFSVFVDEDARDIGNAFLTIDEAKFERERRKIETIMRKYARPFKYREYNYYIKCNHDDGTLRIGSCEVISSGEPYFESKKMARKVIDEIGENRLKKYWFGVADDE